MTRFTCQTLAVLGAVLLAAAAAPAAEVSPSTIDNGGETSSGGTYAVTGSIGQPDAGEMSGGSFALSGGFWDRSHPFVPVELQSFEIVGGASPARAPVCAGAEEPGRATAVSMHLGKEANLTANSAPRPVEKEAVPVPTGGASR